ncbi:MAG: polyphosphate kinase 2 [Pseudomonadota bacterium]|jgi:polyphosphate kinase 2|nr:polyphosphate kinase 2 [Pseudomonadota bacterium]MED5550162.1 polyphosphate kinase 2 [Pseudomonadota bacterium]
MNRTEYRRHKRALQIQLVALQRHLIAHDQRLVVILEGRDAAGKDGTIKRITQHMSPRETRVVALGRPSDRDRASWYFQRFVPHLPADGEIVLFNRSWYNRAGVERVMEFCSEEEYEAFYRDVLAFERLIAAAGTTVLKFYLDISRHEQARRLAERRTSPLTAWKSSPIDAVALDKWDAYSQARNRMLAETDPDDLPWRVVAADDKRRARLTVMAEILGAVECEWIDPPALEAFGGRLRYGQDALAEPGFLAL